MKTITFLIVVMLLLLYFSPISQISNAQKYNVVDEDYQPVSNDFDFKAETINLTYPDEYIYYEDWGTDNISAQWTKINQGGNQYSYYHKTLTMDTDRALYIDGYLGSWKYGFWDWTQIGFGDTKTKMLGSCDDSVYLRFWYRSGSVPDTTHMYFQLYSIVDSVQYTSSQKGITRTTWLNEPLLFYLNYTEDELSYEIIDKATGNLLITDNITDVPDPSIVPYFIWDGLSYDSISMSYDTGKVDLQNYPGANGGGDIWIDLWYITRKDKYDNAINLSWDKGTYDNVLIRRENEINIHENQTNTSGGYEEITNGNSTAQIFTLDYDMRINGVSAYINYSGSPNGTVQIRTTSGNPLIPTSTVLASQSFIPTSTGWYIVNFSEPVFFSAGEYAIVWSNNNTDPYRVYYSNNDNYMGGHKVVASGGGGFEFDTTSAIYYFNGYSSYYPGTGWVDPVANSVDSSESTYARHTVGDAWIRMNSNNCSGTDLGLITAVELRMKTYDDDVWGNNGWIHIIPRFNGTTPGNSTYEQHPSPNPGYGAWVNVFNDSNAPASWTWIDVDNLDADCAACHIGTMGSWGIYMLQMKVTYQPPTDVAFRIHGYGPPRTIYDGDSIYYGSGSNYVDYNVSRNSIYYYTIWGNNSGMFEHPEYSWNYTRDTMPPDFEVTITPRHQAMTGGVNITCRVTDNYGVSDEPTITIIGPYLSIQNATMNYNILTDTYWYHNTYTYSGLYNITIYAEDISGNPGSYSDNFRIQGWLDIYDVYPPDGATGLPLDTIVGLYVNCLDEDFQLLDIYYTSNVTGNWEILGANLSVPGGEEWYQMSSYGVVDSPYGMTVTYDYDDFYSNIYHSNKCIGNDIGEIIDVSIGTTELNCTVKPIFDGERNGTNFHLSSDAENISIYGDINAPTEWMWEDIKNLDLWTTTSTQKDVFIVVTYNMGYGENLVINWAVNVTDGYIWLNETYSFTTLSETPVISNENPKDVNASNYLNPTLSVDVDDPNGDIMNISFYYLNETEEWNQMGSTQTGGNGTYNQMYIQSNEYSGEYLWKVVANDGVNKNVSETRESEKIYRYVMRDVHVPPINFNATSINASAINLTWSKDEHSDITLIKRRTDRFPTFDDPGFIYEGYGTSYIDTSMITPATGYYYTSWTYNESDGRWSYNSSTTIELSNPTSPTNLHIAVLAYNETQVTWNNGVGSDTTFIYRKKNSYPTDINDLGATLIYEGTGTFFIDRPLGGNISYYYRAWSWCKRSIIHEDNISYNHTKYSGDYANDFNTTFVGPPTLIPSVYNIENTSAILKIFVLGDGGETSTCGLYWGNATTHFNITKGSYNTDDIYEQAVTLSIAETYYFQPWGYNAYGFSVGENVTFASRPHEPTVLSAITVSSSEIVLAWDKGFGADTTYIRYKQGSYPVNILDGTLTYNDTDVSTTTLGLGGNLTYYFRAWSYNETSNIYSSYYAEDYDTTLVGIPIVNYINPPINIENTTATFKGLLTYDNGDACTAGFRYGLIPGVYTNNVTSTGKYTTGQLFTYDETGLLPGRTYYYQAWALNCLHFNNSTENNFWTKPVAPNNFTATAYGATRINLTWIKPLGADKTKIVRKLGNYPTNMSDGETRYFGTESYYHDWEWYPLLEHTTYYYRAWSYNNTGTLGVGFYSNDNSSSSDTTGYLPYLTNEIPLDGSININRYVEYELRAYGENTLNVTFYNTHDLNRAYERLGDRGSSSGIITYRIQGWSDPVNCSGALYATRPYGLLSKKGDYGSYTSYTAVVRGGSGSCYTEWVPRYRTIRDCVYVNLGGSGNKVTSWKPTIYLNEPMLIGGIYVSSYPGSFQLDSRGEGYDGYTTYMKFDYHDYYLNQWITASYEKPGISSGYLYTDAPVFVDAVRTYKIAEKNNYSASSSFHYFNGAINYITCIPPAEINQQNVTDGEIASFTSGQKELDYTYYWGGVVNDSLDLGFTEVFNFTTEKITMENEIPTHGIILTDKDIDHDCSVMVNHTGGDSMNITFYYKSGQFGSNWILGKTYTNVYDGVYNFTYEDSYYYGATYYWRVVADDSLDTYTEDYWFKVRGALYPFAPEFTLNVINTTKIYINNIYSNDFADTILVVYNTTNYPLDPNDGILLFNDSTTVEYNLTNLYPGTKYYFSSFSWNRTDDVYSRRTKSATTASPTITNVNTSTINTTGVKLLNISANDYTDKIMIRYKELSYPINETDGILVANLSYTSGEIQFDHYGLIYNTTYYYRLYPWNATSNYWGANETIMGKTNGPPRAYDETPLNNSYDVNINETMSIRIWDFDGGLMDVFFRTNQTGAWVTFANWSDVGNGWLTTYYHPSYLQEQFNMWTVNVTDGTFWYNATYYYTSGSLPVVKNISWTANQTRINLSWDRMWGSDKTLIRRSNITYPFNTSDGELVYFGIDETINDTGLQAGTLYYYTFWGHNDTSGEHSIENMTLLTLTKPYPPTSVNASPASHRIVNISWTMGEGANTTAIVTKLDTYPQNLSDGIIIYNSTINYYLHSSLKPDDYFVAVTPLPGTNNLGVYPIGGEPFNQSYDNDTSTKWDPNSQQSDTFSYVFADPQRLVGTKIFFQDFYNDPGATWNANFTKIEIQENGTDWYTDWTGLKYNNGIQPEWWNYTLSKVYENVTEVRFTANIDFIQPNIYEVVIGKLGYRHKYGLVSFTEQGGLIQASDPVYIEAKTDDTPYNTRPILENITPADDALRAEPTTKLSVKVIDGQGQNISLTLQTNFTTGIWHTVQTINNINNETVNFTLPRWGFRKDVWWRIIADDHSDVSDSYFYQGTDINDTGIMYFHTRPEYAEPKFDVIAPANPTNKDTVQLIDESGNATTIWWRANGQLMKTQTYPTGIHAPFNLTLNFNISNIWNVTQSVENETDAGYIFSEYHIITVNRNITYQRTPLSGINYVGYHLTEDTDAVGFINQFGIPNGWWIHKYNTTTKEWMSAWVNELFNNFEISKWDVVVVVGDRELTKTVNITSVVDTEQHKSIPQGINYLVWTGNATRLMDLSFGLQSGDWIHVYDTLSNTWSSRWIGNMLVGNNVLVKPYDVIIVSTGGARTINIGGSI